MSGPAAPAALTEIVHASTVAFGAGSGVLIRGASGAGKSRLALTLIEAGAQLVSDDRTVVMRDGDALFVRPPRTIEGLIEVRGLGIVRLAARRLARLQLVIDLGTTPPPRLPPHATITIMGVSLPCLRAGDDMPFPAAVRHYIGSAIHAG